MVLCGEHEMAPFVWVISAGFLFAYMTGPKDDAPTPPDDEIEP